MAALLVAGLITAPALANRGPAATSLNRFVEARLAESSNALQTAATLYAESLKEQPDNLLLAKKAYVNAIQVGDFELAVRAVGILQLRGKADPEMPLLRFAEAFAQRDWSGAERAIVELEALKNFAFMQPFLEGWLQTAQGRDATASLAQAQTDPTSKYYLEEQLILNRLASRLDSDSIALLADVVQRNDARMAPVRMIAARHFWANSDPLTAKNILQSQATGPEQNLFEQIDAGVKKGAAQKVTASVGLAFLFQRLSNDLALQKARFPSQVMALTGAYVAGKSDYAHLVVGRAYAAAESHNIAVSEFTKISADSPYHVTGLRSEMASLVAQDKYDQALTRLESALNSQPDAPELHLLKGQILQAKGENEAAARSFGTAVKLGEEQQLPDMAMASYWLALGGAQEQAGIWPEALESLQTANRLLPNSATILNYLGYAQLERRENSEQAIAAIKQAHELHSTSPAITDSLGWAYFITGDHHRAVKYLEDALEGQPQDPTINEHLGDAYWTVGRQYEARYAWKSAKLFAEDEGAQRLARKIDLGLLPDLVSP